MSGFSANAWVPGATFASFGNPVVNIHDLDAFVATLTIGPGGVTASNNVGIWDDDSGGSGHLIARIGSGARAGHDGEVPHFQRSGLQQ